MKLGIKRMGVVVATASLALSGVAAIASTGASAAAKKPVHLKTYEIGYQGPLYLWLRSSEPRCAQPHSLAPRPSMASEACGSPIDKKLAALRSTKCCLCRDGDAEVVEEGLYADAEGLIVAVDAGPDGGLASQPGAADAGEYRSDDLVAEGEQGGDGPGCVRGRVVAP